MSSSSSSDQIEMEMEMEPIIPGGANTKVEMKKQSQEKQEEVKNTSVTSSGERKAEDGEMDPNKNETLVIRLRVDFPKRDEIIKVTKKNTLFDLKLKTVSIIGEKVQPDSVLSTYEFQCAFFGSDVFPINGDHLTLGELAIQPYCTVFARVPEGLRATFDKPKPKPRPKVKLSHNGQMIKSMLPQLDDFEIEEALQRNNNDTDSTLQFFLTEQSKFDKYLAKPVTVSKDAIKQVRDMLPQFDEDVISSYLVKNTNNVERTIEELFKIGDISSESIASLKSMFPNYSNDEIKHALIKANKKPDLAIEHLLKKPPKKNEEKKTEEKKHKETVEVNKEHLAMIREMFPSISENVISHALIQTKNKMEQAIAYLLAMKEEEIKEIDKKGKNQKEQKGEQDDQKKQKEQKEKEQREKEQKEKEQREKEQKEKEQQEKQQQEQNQKEKDDNKEQQDKDMQIGGEEQLKDEKVKEEKEEKQEKQEKQVEKKHPPQQQTTQLQKQESKIIFERLIKPQPPIDILPLDLGVTLYKGVLSEEEQLDILKECVSMNENVSSLSKQASSSLKPITLLFANWYSDGKKNVSSTSSLYEFAKQTFKRMRGSLSSNSRSNTEDECVKYDPDGFSALLYMKLSSLAQHRDSKQGWVMGISIGASALFFFSEKPQSKKIEVRLDSGDVILYNGTRLLHGIEKIFPDSAPTFWKREVSTENGLAPSFERLVISFRDSSHVQ